MAKFLLIDDDPGVIGLTARVLSYAFPGCQVIKAANGQDGVSAAFGERPDVILLDVTLPDMDGFEVCRRVKGDDQTRHIPILMITGDKTQGYSRVKGLELGADSYLYKPFVPEELAAQVKVVLRIKTAEDLLRSQKADLEKAFQEQTRELQNSREALEHKVVELESILAQQTQELIRADRLAAVGILAAGIAHEVNNPNTFISSNLQTFKLFWQHLEQLLTQTTAAAPADQARQIEFIRQEMPRLVHGMEEGTRRIAGIVSGIKNYAAGSSEQQRVVDIADVIDAALHLCSNQLKHDIVVRKNIAPDLPKVFASEQMLCQVFVNLFMNAAAAMKEHYGEGVLSIDVAVDGNNVVVVSVTDTGHGIRPEHMKNLFNPFFTTRREKGGTGLGLFVAYGIVKGHNGQMDAESPPGKGATFRVKIPALDKNQAVEATIEETEEVSP